MIKLSGNVLTIKTNVSMEEYHKVLNFAPKALKLTDDNGNDIYAIAVDEVAELNSKFAIFNSEVDGKLAMTLVLPFGVDKEEVVELYGSALMSLYTNLSEVELQIEEVLQKISTIENLFE